MKTSILEYLEESARKYPDKTAFADDLNKKNFYIFPKKHLIKMI